jgi:hypothetical protein
MTEKNTRERKFKAALKRIADGRYNDMSCNPSEWAGVIAYLALGGRVSDGQRLDRVDEL